MASRLATLATVIMSLFADSRSMQVTTSFVGQAGLFYEYRLWECYVPDCPEISQKFDKMFTYDTGDGKAVNSPPMHTLTDGCEYARV